MQPQDASGREAPPERVKAVAIALSEIAAESRVVRDIHNVRVRETDDGEIVNFHCYVDPALTVQNVHEKVDALERGLRERSPSIKRVDRPRRADELIRQPPSNFRAGHPRSNGNAHRHRPTHPPQGLPRRPTGWWRPSRSIFRCTRARPRSARRLALKPNPHAPAAPLVLDGDGLNLVSLKLDGAVLPAENYVATPDNLTIAQPPNGAVHA